VQFSISFPTFLSISERFQLLIPSIQFVRPAQPRKVRIYLLSGISASGDDGNTADLKDCKISSQYLRIIALQIFLGLDSHFMATVVGVDY